MKDKISFGIKELFGIQEAEASSVARQGIGLLGSTEIGKGEPVVAPTFSRMLANPKEEAIKWLVEHMDGGMLLTTLIALSAPSINEYNLSSEFEKRKHDDNSNKPSTSKQQQKVSAASFIPDPGDLEPDDDEKNVENKDEIKYKKSNYEKGDDIGLHRFTERFEKTKLRDPKSGQYLEPDFGRGSGSGGHGGSHWKLYDGKRRIGTIWRSVRERAMKCHFGKIC
ncbi:hypothetical protein [Candidatus Tisiphia endosymbiont of Parasteatoda lunata]|uniref:hypothetical protein n=1 Tax=Candidatus Tisiphia endosymbiont of Parasteatoda lunata TaxID=3066275 RepID=UPI00313DEE70